MFLEYKRYPPYRLGGREPRPSFVGGLGIYGGLAVGTNVYIDGFNLYYGALRDTTYKWLDLAALCTTLFPRSRINRIRYFTARVKAWPHDPQAPVRQDIYFRALRTIPYLSIHEGHFQMRPVWLPQLPFQYCTPGGPAQTVKVMRTEEKGSDVNLATLLLVDCFGNDFDEAVVISNDSDLALPVKLVRTQFGKRIGTVNPHSQEKVSGHLIKAASFCVRTINKSVLASCQFPAVLSDSHGTFHKPASW